MRGRAEDEDGGSFIDKDGGTDDHDGKTSKLTRFMFSQEVLLTFIVLMISQFYLYHIDLLSLSYGLYRCTCVYVE